VTWLLLLLAALSPAEVVDAGANGFTVKTTVTIKASPDDVYRKLVRNIGDWWDSAHTFSGGSHNLSIEDKATGCFCEKLPNGGGVRHMEVVNVAPGKSLVMIGALGPLQSFAATGTMSIRLTPDTGGTKLEVTYALSGYLPAGMNTLAAPVDQVINQQFTRLKNYAETGRPQSSEPR
jgi:uncharacterized protein YndB with AHSA1/START domain